MKKLMIKTSTVVVMFYAALGCDDYTRAIFEGQLSPWVPPPADGANPLPCLDPTEPEFLPDLEVIFWSKDFSEESIDVTVQNHGPAPAVPTTLKVQFFVPDGQQLTSCDLFTSVDELGVGDFEVITVDGSGCPNEIKEICKDPGCLFVMVANDGHIPEQLPDGPFNNLKPSMTTPQ